MASNVWIFSDPHYGHRNIVRGESNWKDKDGNPAPGPRDFDTLEEHNQALVDGINNNVKESDTLYCLGDWAFGGIKNIAEFRMRIHCRTIHLCLGNHDHHIRENKLIPNLGRGKLTEELHYNEKGVSPLCEPVTTQELFTSVNQVKQKKIAGHMFFMSHYAHRVWDKAHHGAIHLYGHSHGSLPDYVGLIEDKEDEWLLHQVKYKCMDVGVDTHPEFRPYNLDEILEIMKDRVPLSVDHHNERTT